MNRLIIALLLTLTCLTIALPAEAALETAAEKRARVLKARQEAQQRKERAEREAQLQREREEHEAQLQREREEHEAKWQQERERMQKEREEANAANRAYYEEQERKRAERAAREQAEEEQAAADEKARWKKIGEDVASTALPENWQESMGMVKVDEGLRLKSPVVVFMRASELRRYMTWLEADVEAANQYALECVQNDSAYVLAAGSKVLVTDCEEEDEADVESDSLFFVSAPDGTEGWASNLILSQHRAAKKKKTGAKK